ncbi:MAG: glycosyltransferase family 4 protein [Acidobacteriota bacterium]|nr:glycosyltransferase family 4 protein [Acidobacteriota bacterium]
MLHVVIVYPMDPLGSKIGGVVTFLKGLIAHSPPDFHFDFFGITSDRRNRPLWKRRTLAFGAKSFSFVPVLEKRNENEKDPIPLALKFSLALLLRRVRPAPGVFVFNRIEPSLAFPGRTDPKIGFIHSDMTRQTAAGATEVLWSRWPHAYSLLEKAAFRRLHMVFVNNRRSLEHYMRRHPRATGKFAYVSIWVDPELFFPSAESKRSARENLRQIRPFLPIDDPWIVFAGRLQKVKNPRLAVAGFRQFRRAGGAGKLLIIGEGNLRERIAETIRREELVDDVFLLGEMTQKALADFYRAADILVSTSLTEGGPRSVLEALGSGIPVVTTDVGEVRCFVRSGVSGEIVDASAEDIGNALDRILSRPDIYTVSRCLESVKELTPRRVLQPVYQKIRELGERAGRL